MRNVSKEQIAAAKRMTAIEYLRRYRPDELVKGSAHGEYELRSHNSFKINGESSVWHWKSRDIGGKSALDYLIHVEGVSFVDAVQQLCEDCPAYIPTLHETVERQRPMFVLPPPAPDTQRVTDYLQMRGIALPVIQHCINVGILYESLPYHNCVFVGRDGTGTPRYAALRGTFMHGRPFKAEQAGSDKRYSFCIPPTGLCTKLAVFEAAIDAMAEMTLCGEDKYRLSLGGIYVPTDPAKRMEKPPAALEHFLQAHPEITALELCLDNDVAGRAAAAQIACYYSGRYDLAIKLPPIENGDYADLAQAMRNQGTAPANQRPAPCR